MSLRAGAELPADAVDACLDANVTRYLWVKDLGEAERSAAPATIYARAEQTYQLTKKPLTAENDSWERGLIPTLAAQRDALQEAILGLGMPSLKSLDAVRSYLENNVPTARAGFLDALRIRFLKSGQANTRQRVNILRYRPIESITRDLRDPKIVRGLTELVEESENRARLFYACSKLSWWYGGACADSVALLIDDAHWSGANILFPQLWLEAFQNRFFSDGLRRLAVRMLGRMQSGAAPSDFFSDARQSFIETGASSDVAYELAWKTMALYGNGAHNTGARALTYDLNETQTITGVSLTVIGTAVSVLDFEQRARGQRHYALPERVGGTCLSPKPYHFWLSAYQSHRLTQLGKSRKASAYASMTMAKLYQIKRQMSGLKNSAIEKIFVKPGSHPSLRVMRMDLMLDAAGALYGVGSLDPSADLGALLRDYDAQASGTGGLDAAAAAAIARDNKQAFDRWEEKLQPDFIFEKLISARSR